MAASEPPKAAATKSTCAASGAMADSRVRTPWVAAKAMKRNMKVPQNSARAAMTSLRTGEVMPKVRDRSRGSLSGGWGIMAVLCQV